MVKRRAFANIAGKEMRHRHPQKTVEFLTSWRTISFSRTIVLIFLSSTQQPRSGPGRLIVEVSGSQTIRRTPHTHTHTHTPHIRPHARARGRTALDEGSACRGGHYLHKGRTSMPSPRFESAFPANKCFQTARPKGSAPEQPY